MQNLVVSKLKQSQLGFTKLLQARRFQSEKALWIVVISILTLVYAIQFKWVRDITLISSFKVALINVIPVIILGSFTRLLIRRFVIHRAILPQLGLHIVLATLFTHLFYLLILIITDFQFNWLSEGFNISPFYASATKWQLMQGVVIYGALQGLIYGYWIYEKLHALRKTLDNSSIKNLTEANKGKNSTSSIFVKSEGEYKKIEAQDLIHIEANGDYVILHTRQTTFTSNKSLNTFDDQLEGYGFIRAHRSHLVNMKAIKTAEPTGDGRLSMHLSNGTTIIASRTGSQIFRKQAR